MCRSMQADITACSWMALKRPRDSCGDFSSRACFVATVEGALPHVSIIYDSGRDWGKLCVKSEPPIMGGARGCGQGVQCTAVGGYGKVSQQRGTSRVDDGRRTADAVR